jgi:hypothetical protein
MQVLSQSASNMANRKAALRVRKIPPISPSVFDAPKTVAVSPDIELVR